MNENANENYGNYSTFNEFFSHFNSHLYYKSFENM